MDRTSKSIYRLWGSLGQNGQLHDSPRFAEELAACYNGNLAVLEKRVSNWAYGYQLEHLYRASHWVLDRLEESMTGDNATKRMGPIGWGFMTIGFIPRYWFPTIPPLVPQSGSPENIEPLRDDLKRRLGAIPWRLDEIKECRGKSLHPKMKYLTSSQWMLFLDVHHRHHLAIMRDILKGAR